MSFEKEVLIRARARYEQQKDRRQQQQLQRRERIWRDYPEVQKIDQQLRRSMAAVMAETFRQGGDPQEAVQRIRRENLELQRRRNEILRSAGYPEDYLYEGPQCRKCSDSGYIGERMCECLEKLCLEEQRRELTSLLTTGAPGGFDSFSLDWYPAETDPAWGISPRQQMEMVYETCVNYARRFSRHSRSLLMNGGTGLGKTFLSACIAQQVVSKGFSVVYDTAIHVFSCMEKQKFGGATEEELRMTQRVQECDLLILDDLGTEMTTAFVTPALYSIINGRLLSERPTIISTNLSLGDLSRRYSAQIASRLMGEYINLVFLGRDIRTLKNEYK